MARGGTSPAPAFIAVVGGIRVTTWVRVTKEGLCPLLPAFAAKQAERPTYRGPFPPV